MKTILLGLSCLFLLTSPCFADDIENQTLETALSFAQLIDDSNLQAAYWSGSALLRLANDEQEWLERTERSQKVLGKAVERKVKATRSINSFARLPDDAYQVILFTTRTEHKAKAFETLLLHQVSGIWQVCSYSIH